jgi:hypothetical protein
VTITAGALALPPGADMTLDWQHAHRAGLRLRRAAWRQCAGITSTCRPDGVSAA